MSHLLQKLLLALMPALVLVAGAEVALRLTGAAERCPGYESSTLWVCDPILYFKSNPKQIIDGRRLNAAGFRGRELTPKPPGVYRILALGDSCTFGIVLPGRRESLRYVAEPYPEKLEELAAQRFGPGKVQVLNAGVPGYNSYQGILLLRTKLRDLRPDLITVRFEWDDMLTSPQRRIGNAFHEPSTALGREVQDLLFRTALYAFSRRLGMELQAQLHGEAATPRRPGGWQPNVPLDEYEHNLRRIAEIARARGARVWFLTSPDASMTDEHRGHDEHFGPRSSTGILVKLDGFGSLQHLFEIHAAYNEATRRVGRELEVPVVDMAAVYREHSSEHLFELGDVVHPTQRGHDLEAETLVGRVRLRD